MAEFAFYFFRKRSVGPRSGAIKLILFKLIIFNLAWLLPLNAVATILLTGAGGHGPQPMLRGHVDRPLRYAPVDTDFVITNGEVVATYMDGSTSRLALRNPTTWWPIDQDYFMDDFAFRRPGPLPVRVDLKTGRIRVLRMDQFKGRGGTVPGGDGHGSADALGSKQAAQVACRSSVGQSGGHRIDECHFGTPGQIAAGIIAVAINRTKN